MPGRFSFFHKPGGLAGDHSNFIIGGSHWERGDPHVWRSDHLAEAWSKAAFNLVSFGAGSDVGRTARLARGLDFATAHGMFVLITAQQAGATAAGMDAHTLIELAANLSCHTNMGTPQTILVASFQSQAIYCCGQAGLCWEATTPQARTRDLRRPAPRCARWPTGSSRCC